MRLALATFSALILLTAFGIRAEAGQRYEDGGFVIVQDYDPPRHGYDRDRHERREWRGRGGPRYHEDDRDILSERAVVRRLVRQGFVSIEDIRLRRGRYIVEAIRPNGALVRLSVDAYDGEILSRDRIGWSRDGGSRRPGRDGHEDFDIGGGRLGIYGR